MLGIKIHRFSQAFQCIHSNFKIFWKNYSENVEKVRQAHKIGDFAPVWNSPTLGKISTRGWMSGDVYTNRNAPLWENFLFGHTSYCEEGKKRNNWGENHAIFANPFKFLEVHYELLQCPPNCHFGLTQIYIITFLVYSTVV